MKYALLIALCLVAPSMCANGDEEEHNPLGDPGNPAYPAAAADDANPPIQAEEDDDGNPDILTAGECALLDPKNSDHLLKLCNHFVATGQMSTNSFINNLHQVKKGLLKNNNNN